MREFFGLIIFIVLLCIWSFVFADPKTEPSMVSSINKIPVEKVVQN